MDQDRQATIGRSNVLCFRHYTLDVFVPVTKVLGETALPPSMCDTICMCTICMSTLLLEPPKT